MKNYEEMAHDVLKRIHEYDEKKRKKRKNTAKTVAVVCVALIVTIAGVSAWKGGLMPPPDDTTNNDKDFHLTASEAPNNDKTSAVDQPLTDNPNNMWCFFVSSLEYNGTTFYDNDMENISAYTQDNYIGKVSNFKGDYKDSPNYRINPNDSVYTVKETKYILFVVKENGTIVVMSASDSSIE